MRRYCATAGLVLLLVATSACAAPRVRILLPEHDSLVETRTIPIRAMLFDERGNPIGARDGVFATAVFVLPDGTTKERVSLRDDGKMSDREARNGLWSGSLAPKAEGYYRVSVKGWVDGRSAWSVHRRFYWREPGLGSWARGVLGALQRRWPWIVAAMAALIAIGIVVLRRRSVVPAPRAAATGDAEPWGRLRFVEGPRTGRTLPLTGERITIGRHARNTITLPDDSVAKRQGFIQREPGEQLVWLDASVRGTPVDRILVGGEGDESAATLANGSELQIGPHTLMLEIVSTNRASPQPRQ